MSDITTNMFVFSLTYFKEGGKFYTETAYEYKTKVLVDGTPYMQDIVDHLKKLRDDGIICPGLGTSWNGYILVTHEDSYPTLILPKKLDL